MKIKIHNFEKFDFDFWSNTKRDIIVALVNKNEIESVSEMSRIIKKSFSVTHQHLQDLESRKFVILKKSNNKCRILSGADHKYCMLPDTIAGDLPC